MDNGPRGVRRVVTLVGLAVAAALVWVLLTTLWLWRNQERVVFQPPSIAAEAPAPAQRVEFAAADGRRLFGYLVTPATPATPATHATPATPATNGSQPSPVVIAFHGNADLAAWLVPWAHELADRTGATVLLPEFRGYAGIPGAPTYESSAADARGALAFARSELRATDIVLFGHSLGTGVAAELALYMGGDPPSALVLQAPFTSAREMAARMLIPPIPWLWRRISRVHFDTRSIVAQLECPVWVAHGTRDVVIPTRMGRQVYEAARHKGELLIVEGAGHNDVPDVGGEKYWGWIVKAVTGDS
jgi:fermentation-respiration switch protein FrsA (DUF1100 family)